MKCMKEKENDKRKVKGIYFLFQGIIMIIIISLLLLHLMRVPTKWQHVFII